MKRLLNISLALVALLFGTIVLGGCTNDLDSDKIGPNADGTVECIVIPFASAQDDIVVQTRAQNLDDLNENRVRNIYVFLFDGSGNKVYAKYFDTSNKVANVDASEDDCWSVVNTSDTSAKRTQGEIKIHTTANAAETYKLYAITNLDSSFVDISSDRLSQIQTEAELLRTKGTMLQQTVSRSGYLQMSGSLLNVHIDINGDITDGANPVTLHLFHMDAKVQVTLKQGTAVKELNNASIQVINLPRVGYVWSPYSYTGESYDTTATGLDAVTSVADTFDGPESGFDKVLQETNGGITTNTYDAWFYMLESRQTPKKAIPMICPDAGWEDYDSEKTNYNPYFERARQTKELGSGPLSPGYGTNVVDANGDRDFVYANNLSPYMLIKCSIAMDLVDDAAGQELGGDVTYIIPLGDAGTSATPTEAKVNNFNTNRNTFYHYTITVNGVHNIRVEVDARQTELSSDENFQMEENQPGAMGQVVVAKEEIAICDCHYVSKTMTFHAKNVSQNLTWHVNTPFGEGGPEVDIDGNDIIPPGLDYEWVHFRVNKKTSSGTYYSDQRRAYTNAPYDPETNPDGIMNVSQLVKYMKQQKAIYDTEDPAAPETWSSDFDTGMMVTYDAEGNVSGEVSDPEGRKICVTAFVNEFYYDYNPLNPLEPIPADFWKQYVNWPTDRYMYILSESNLSRDQESRATGSVVTIQQHPIQSIYDTTPSNTSFSTAWGLEQTDEFADKWSYWSSTSGGSRGNTSKDNGRLNTMKEWELVNSGGTTYTPANWDTYMDFEVRNDLPQLHEKYNYLRYSCMTRNRDNDGDGVIDHDEVRWYMAALNQLFGMTIGSDVINFESRLYNRTPATEALYGYRQHVASSTASGSSASNNPTVLWAEQLSSTSSMTNSQSWTNKGVAANKVTKWTIRCLRNLGTAAETIANPTSTDLQELPEDYIAIDEGNLSITCVRLNPKVLRAQQEQELVYSDEYSEQCRLPKRFYIAPSQVASLPSVSGYDLGHEVLNRNQQIEDVGSSVDAGYCPEGYRMPNLRELTMMANYFPDYVNSGAFCRTYYSLGILGSQKDVDVNNDDGDKAGWTARNSGGEAYVQMVPGGYGTIGVPRCVRDASVEELQAEGLL